MEITMKYHHTSTTGKTKPNPPPPPPPKMTISNACEVWIIYAEKLVISQMNRQKISGTDTVDNSLAVSYKIKNTLIKKMHLVNDSAFSFLDICPIVRTYIYTKPMSTCSQYIHNSPNQETTKIPFNG